LAILKTHLEDIRQRRQGQEVYRGQQGSRDLLVSVGRRINNEKTGLRKERMDIGFPLFEIKEYYDDSNMKDSDQGIILWRTTIKEIKEK
jgi:hypothetical protein